MSLWTEKDLPHHSFMTTMTATTLLLIDCQKDFHPGGSLAIPTAGEDARRIAALIEERPPSRIICTLDSHAVLHIAHPQFWWSEEEPKRHPEPFTIISSQDLRQGKWIPRDDLQLSEDQLEAGIFGSIDHLYTNNKLNLRQYCIDYAERLEAKGRFQLCIWPEHCLIGGMGHTMVDEIQAALQEWSANTGGSVEWVLKGQALLTEMYSALEADVPVNAATALNQALLTSLRQSERLVVGGQALSHCVNYTLRDIVRHWPKNELSKVYLLRDCSSAVPGFEAAADDFVEDMRAAGVHIVTSKDV